MKESLLFSRQIGSASGSQGRDGADSSDDNYAETIGACIKDARVHWLGVVFGTTDAVLANSAAARMATVVVVGAAVLISKTDGRRTRGACRVSADNCAIDTLSGVTPRRIGDLGSVGEAT